MTDERKNGKVIRMPGAPPGILCTPPENIAPVSRPASQLWRAAPYLLSFVFGFVRASRRSPLLFIIHYSLFTLFVLCIFPSAPSYAATQSISVGDISFGTVGEEDFLSGFAFLPDVPVYWESDVPWIITIQSLDPDLGQSDDGTYVKPLGDLQYRVSGESQWKKMRQDADELDSGTETGGGTVPVDFRVILAWKKDSPGTYRAVLRFTILEL